MENISKIEIISFWVFLNSLMFTYVNLCLIIIFFLIIFISKEPNNIPHGVGIARCCILFQ